MIFEPQVVEVDTNIDEYVNVSITEESAIAVNANVTVTHAKADYYEGDYVVIPQSQEVVLNTTDKLMSENVVIAPIPNNYGLITWDGSSLTVS